jgi:hypothetical protein
MNLKIKKNVVLFFAIVMCFVFMKDNALAQKAPRVAVQIAMNTDADSSDEVRTNQEITATVTWKGVRAASGEPITIQATNGAKILINNEADVLFTANGTPAPITSVVSNLDDQVTFMSGTPVTSPLDNQITFRVKAPAQATTFHFSVKIGSKTVPSDIRTNYIEKSFSAKPYLKVETSDDEIVASAPFEVFGEVAYDDIFMIALEVRNKETNQVVFDSFTMDILDNGNFNFGTFNFDDSHEVGTYIVEAILLDNSFTEVTSAKKEILYKNMIDVTVKYIDEDTGEEFDSHTESYVYGSSVLIPLNYSLNSSLGARNYAWNSTWLNGEQIDNFYTVRFTANEPTELIYAYHKTGTVEIKHAWASSQNQFGGQLTSIPYLIGHTYDIVATAISGRNVVGVLVNNQPASLINGNTIRLTISDFTTVIFLYE